jgi:hypothetical protein
MPTSESASSWTFRQATVTVFVLWLCNLGFIVWGPNPVEIFSHAGMGGYLQGWCNLLRTPIFAVPLLALLAAGFVAVHLYRVRYPDYCVSLYAALLGAVGGRLTAGMRVISLSDADAFSIGDRSLKLPVKRNLAFDLESRG